MDKFYEQLHVRAMTLEVSTNGENKMQAGQIVLLQINATAPLAAAIRTAAEHNYQSVSDFMRQAAIEKMRALGIEPAERSK
jgi:uncharacterized protein YggE